MADQLLEKQDELSPELEVKESSDGAPLKKVELDLDDAPFLQAEEKAPPPVPAELEPADDEADKARRKKKKLMILGGIAAAVLIIAAAAVWWFFFRTPPPAPPAGPEPEVIVVPSTPPVTGPAELVREFAPFIVPLKDPEGKTYFLICKFSAITKEPAVNQEMEQQRVPLRDAIYYYLRGKDSAFLLDAHNGESIKKDLLSVFNDYLTQGKLEDIVFESYLNR